MSAAALRAVGENQFVLEGEVSFSTADQLLTAGNILFADVKHARLDLSAVTKIDSAALALMIEWLRQANLTGRSLTLTQIPEKLLAIARLTGTEDIVVSESHHHK